MYLYSKVYHNLDLYYKISYTKFNIATLELLFL